MSASEQVRNIAQIIIGQAYLLEAEGVDPNGPLGEIKRQALSMDIVAKGLLLMLIPTNEGGVLRTHEVAE